MNLRELQERLFEIESAQFVGITSISEPELRRRRNPFFGCVWEVSRVNGVVCWNYGKAVNRQRIREQKPADFDPVPRVWGRRVRGCPLVVWPDQSGALSLYLEVKRERIAKQYFDRDTLKSIDAALLAPFLPKRRPSRQDLHREVILRDYRLDHIAELRIGKERLQVEPLCWLMNCLKLK